MSALMSAMAESWSSVSVEVEGVFELVLHVGVGREGRALSGLALGVEAQKLGGHVGHRFFDAGLGLLPGLRAELVELRRGSGVGGAVLLDEVEARERDVELGLVGELEDHQFERRLAVLFDHSQTAVLRDAVLDMHDVVADGEVAEVGDEGGGLGLGAAHRASGDVGVVDEVLRAEEDDLRGGGLVEVEDLDAVGDGCLDDDRRAQITGEVARLGVDGGAARSLIARTESVGELVLLQQSGEALHLTLVRSGEEDASVFEYEGFDRFDQRRNGAVEALRGAGMEVDLGEIAAVGVEDIDEAELVEFAAGEPVQQVVEVPRGEVDIVGPDEVADAGAVVALLDLVPPALALVLHHGRLFDEDAGGWTEQVEERLVGSRDRSEELPAGEDGRFAGPRGHVREQLRRFFSPFEVCPGEAAAGQAGVDGGEQLLGDGRFCERQQQRVVEGAAGALGLGVELADGLDLVAEEIDADGAVGLRGEDVDDAAANGDLTGHFDNIDAGVADGEEVFEQHLRQVLLADAQVQGEGTVEIAREEPHAGGFERRDDEAGGVFLVAGNFPERRGALLLDIGVRREVFEGENVVSRQAKDLLRGEGSGEVASGEDGGVECLGGLVVRDDDDAGGGGGLYEERQIEGAGGEGEAGDTSSPRTGA